MNSMHERKALMSDLSDGFIALPGGFGTFEEFCEVVTWSQLGLQSKPCGLLNVENYYAPLLELFDHAVREGFLREENRRLVWTMTSQTLDKMMSIRPEPVAKWIGRKSARAVSALLKPTCSEVPLYAAVEVALIRGDASRNQAQEPLTSLCLRGYAVCECTLPTPAASPLRPS